MKNNSKTNNNYDPDSTILICILNLFSSFNSHTQQLWHM